MIKSKEKLYRKKYEEQKKIIEKMLLPGEEIEHCVDAVSFDGMFYIPEWCITNYGRGYSLFKKDWLFPQAVGNNRNYWGYKGVNKQPMVHQLVVTYFANDSDKTALDFFGEDGVEIHHIIPIEIPEELKVQTKENAQARIKHCMKYNNKNNLVFQEKTIDHINDKRIAKGKKTIGEMKGTEKVSNVEKFFVRLSHNSGKLSGNSNGAHYVYSNDDKGGIIKKRRVVFNFKGTD